jgi:small-conductance mechanosensitive channel
LLLTAIITLSSPTIAANAMAGFMLRSLRSFAVGDFIQVGEFFGRVTERDLFHVEIQTEDRDLLTIPNTYLASHPIKVVLATGTVVSAEVSLGYDVDNRIVEEALLEAIQAAGLEEGFVHIKALGDFSVVYRAAGFLSNVKQMLSMRSDLRRQMIDQLHQRGIEIVSPSFMNQRANTQPVIPKRKFVVPNQQTDMPENLVFDKAERAQQIKELQDSYSELKLSLAEADTDEESLARKKRRMKAIKRAIGMLEKQID